MKILPEEIDYINNRLKEVHVLLKTIVKRDKEDKSIKKKPKQHYQYCIDCNTEYVQVCRCKINRV